MLEGVYCKMISHVKYGEPVLINMHFRGICISIRISNLAVWFHLGGQATKCREDKGRRITKTKKVTYIVFPSTDARNYREANPVLLSHVAVLPPLRELGKDSVRERGGYISEKALGWPNYSLRALEGSLWER